MRASLRRSLNSSRSLGRLAPEQIGDPVALRAELQPQPADAAVEFAPGRIDDERLGIELGQCVNRRHVEVELLAQAHEEVLLRPAREQHARGLLQGHTEVRCDKRNLPAAVQQEADLANFEAARPILLSARRNSGTCRGSPPNPLYQVITAMPRRARRRNGAGLQPSRSNNANGESFTFPGFEFRRAKARRGKRGGYVPTINARIKLLRRLKEEFRCYRSQPVERAVNLINPTLCGWANYFRVGMASRCFSRIRDRVEKKTRRLLMQRRGRRGFGWKR